MKRKCSRMVIRDAADRKVAKRDAGKEPAVKSQGTGRTKQRTRTAGRSRETKNEIRNHRVYLYEDEYVSGDKYISGHGKLVAVFDSTKEYCRC